MNCHRNWGWQVSRFKWRGTDVLSDLRVQNPEVEVSRVSRDKEPVWVVLSRRLPWRPHMHTPPTRHYGASVTKSRPIPLTPATRKDQDLPSI